MKRTVIGTVVVLALVVLALGLAAHADESHGIGGNQVAIYQVDENAPDGPAKELSGTPSNQSSLEESSKVGLPEAARIAEDAVFGEAVEAELEEEDGQLFYSIEVATDNGLIDVIVDPGSGNVLFCGQDSKKKDKDNKQKNKKADKDDDDDYDDDDDDKDND
ncbi:MAG: PepSY domain-containing protein [Desulfotomaculaceae bacterium]|nr:PepSY domain-containing protein [Desulfotomaculaceae bacterium]